MHSLTLKHLRENVCLRTILLPAALLIRKRNYQRYLKSEDSKYIKTLRNKHKGKRCFIIGNGPSLSAHDLDRLKDEEITFASNIIYDIFPYTEWRPTYYMCMDKDLLTEMLVNKTDLGSLAGAEMFCANHRLVQKLRTGLNIHEILLREEKYSIRVCNRVMASVSEDVSDHFSGTQSISCTMIEMAFYMGISEIYLLGMDHSFGIEIDMNGNKEVHSDVQPHFKEQKDQAMFPAQKEAMTKCFEVLREYADRHHISIKNATRGGKLEVFERADFDQIIGGGGGTSL